MQTKLSVVIPVYQEEGQTFDTSFSYVNLYYQNFGVISVANGRTDKTVDVAMYFKLGLDFMAITKKGGNGPP